jgi:hypothetical protein
MNVAVIDVVDWCSVLNLEDGRPTEVQHPLVESAIAVARDHPFPGDLDPTAPRWVTDTALDLVSRYDPQFMILIHGSPYFTSAFTPMTASEREQHIAAVFSEIDSFVRTTGFVTVIVGLGDMTSYLGHADVTGCDGLVVAGGMSNRFAGAFEPSHGDLERLANVEGIARIVSKDSFRKQFGGTSVKFYERFPDYLLVAREGYVFRGLGGSARRLYNVPKYDDQIPLHTGLGAVSAITDIPELVLQVLRGGERVALVLVEAVGCDSFPRTFVRISNSRNWYCYSVGEGQYLTLMTGRHLADNDYPPGYRYHIEDDERKAYPLSSIYTEMPKGTIAQRYEGRSATVACRGLFTHVIPRTDIAVEGLARGLYNHGVMAVVNLDRTASTA